MRKVRTHPPHEVAPTTPTPEATPTPPGRDIGPNRETPRQAVEAAAAIIAEHGVTNAIRAFDLALRETKTPDRAAADIAELARLTGMRRRYAEIAPGITVRLGKPKP